MKGSLLQITTFIESTATKAEKAELPLMATVQRKVQFSMACKI
jgi:hypothetical protein